VNGFPAQAQVAAWARRRRARGLAMGRFLLLGHIKNCARSRAVESKWAAGYFFWFRPKFTVQVDSSFIYFQKLLFFEELNYV
jgi:hypothetical protein